jgi:hypothetical protein
MITSKAFLPVTKKFIKQNKVLLVLSGGTASNVQVPAA